MRDADHSSAARRRRRAIASPAAALALLLTAGVAACGGDGASDTGSGQRPVEERADGHEGSARADETVHHIHGLGVDRSDGTLYVATHTGLFAASRGERRMTRVADSAPDLMGFTVAGDRRFVASGHPDPRDAAAPPNLGLIESRDGGRTWRSVSLLGEADFHVLRASGPRVYGYDGTQGRLMVSSDRGRRWTQRQAPGAAFDLAIAPDDPDRIVASTDRGLFASTDAGERWRPLRDDAAGLLAWPAADRLLLADGRGRVHRSADGGRRWRPVGRIGGPPVALTADGPELYAALADSTVKRSTDGGATWTVRAAP